MEYEGYLNERYGLCAMCQLSFKNEINQQNTQIKEMYSEEFEKRKPKSGLRKLKRKVSLPFLLTFMKLF